jgi:hypothetical protein
MGDEAGAARARLRGSGADGAPTGSPSESLELITALMNQLPDDPGAAGEAHDDGERVLAALILLRHLRAELSGWEPDLVAAARAAGVSWAKLAPALGVTSRQAAELRYLRMRPSPGGEPTAEGRVRAERDRRAGDRAVAAWAQRAAGTLRQLAAEVIAAEGLTTGSDHTLTDIRAALADNDPTALLGPLREAREHLDTYPHLADRINAILDQTDQMRQQPHHHNPHG